LSSVKKNWWISFTNSINFELHSEIAPSYEYQKFWHPDLLVTSQSQWYVIVAPCAVTSAAVRQH